MSFRRRVTLISVAAVAITVVLASLVTYAVVRDVLRGQVDDSLRVAARPLTAPLEPPPGAAGALPPARLGGPSIYAQRVNRDGDVLLSVPDGATALPVESAVLAVARGDGPPFFRDRTVGGVHVRLYTAPGSPGQAVQVARSVAEVDDALGTLRLVLVGVALAGIALAGLLGRLATRAAVRPVADLTEAAEHVAATGDLARRIAAAGDDELARLAASFNTMLAALEASRRDQRRLVADASHELRTPLTSLRTNLEVLAQETALDPGDRERLRRDVVGQLEELTVLVGDLVELARDDEPRPVAVEEVRLDELVAHAVMRAGRHHAGVAFSLDAEPVLVAGVPSRLDRAVANLLDNAAKWSPPGGTVEVGVRDGEVTVRDHGPGISDQDLPFVFDRFYRSVSARGRAGSGLGLAIVRQVAEAHGGRATAERAPDGGARLRLRLPGAPAPAPGGSPLAPATASQEIFTG